MGASGEKGVQGMAVNVGGARPSRTPVADSPTPAEKHAVPWATASQWETSPGKEAAPGSRMPGLVP